MTSFPASRFLISSLMISIVLLATASRGYSQTTVTNDPPSYGPFNAVFLPDGDGLKKPLIKNDSVLRADSPWSLYAWVKPAEASHTLTLVAGFGDPTDEFSRYLALDGDHLDLGGDAPGAIRAKAFKAGLLGGAKPAEGGDGGEFAAGG